MFRSNFLRISGTLLSDAINSRLAYLGQGGQVRNISNVRTAKLIDGLAVAKDVKNAVKADVQKWVASGHRPPHLTAVLVGDDPASATYVRNKIKAAEYTGITSKTLRLPSSITEADLLQHVQSLSCDPAVDGILIQLPLPKHIRKRTVCHAVIPQKDVDGFHVVNLGRLCIDLHGILPCTPAGIMELLRSTGIKASGKTAVVLGRSKHVGLPTALLLQAYGTGDATVTICHSQTSRDQLYKQLQMADIVVAAMGKPNMVTAEMIKEGAIVIDVGINQIVDKKTGQPKLVGDVDFESVCTKAAYITPVPGGVGPMTVAMLMRNTLTAAKQLVNYDAYD